MTNISPKLTLLHYNFMISSHSYKCWNIQILKIRAKLRDGLQHLLNLIFTHTCMHSPKKWLSSKNLSPIFTTKIPMLMWSAESSNISIINGQNLYNVYGKSVQLINLINPMPAELRGQKIQYYTPSAKINSSGT